MVALVEIREELAGTEGFTVEAPDGRLGTVEATRHGALVVRMADGARALLPRDQVVTVDGEYRWVVVPPGVELVELEPPPPAPPHRRDRPHLRLVPHVHIEVAERPLWQQIAILYGSIAFAIVLLITVAFATAWLVTGAAY